MVSIGIHISQNSVCFAELSLEGTKLKPNSFYEHFFENQISQKEKFLFISRHLEKIEQKYKGKSLRFCYGLSQNLVTSFLIHFPFKEKFKILRTLPYEIEDKSPFHPDKIFFDARICKIKNETKSSVLCFVTPEENVNEFLAHNAQLKHKPYLLSCEGSALANLLELWNNPLSQIQNPMSPSTYIYLGTQSSQILFYKEGHLAHISVLDWAVVDIVEQMKQLYNLTSKKAWEEFFTKSFILTEIKGFTKEQVFFSNLIKKQIQILIPKLKLFKISLETEQKTQIKEAVIFGPGSLIKNLTAFLTAEISINVSRLKTLAYPYFEWNKNPLAFVAFGLALEGLKSSPYHGLNFLQSMKKEDSSLFPRKWVKTGMILLLGFVIFTAFAFVRKQESFKLLNKVESVFINYGRKITFLEESRINIESIKSFLKTERATAENEKVIKEKLNAPNPMDSLQLISKKIGEAASKWNLRIHHFKAKDRTVEITGLVDTSSLKNFRAQLESLAKGPIQDNSSSQNSTLLKEQNKTTSTRSGLEKQREAEQNGSTKQEEINLLKNKDLNSSETNKTLLEQQEQSFFSYFFELKGEL